MMFATRRQLGLIPDWQFSDNPAININLNPHVQIPDNFPHGQRTVQPIGWFAENASGDPLAPTGGLTVTPDASLGLGCGFHRPSAVAGARVAGLGITMAHWAEPRADLKGIEIFDSWAWKNRKWLVIGGVGLVGLAALAGLGAILR